MNQIVYDETGTLKSGVIYEFDIPFSEKHIKDSPDFGPSWKLSSRKKHGDVYLWCESVGAELPLLLCDRIGCQNLHGVTKDVDVLGDRAAIPRVAFYLAGARRTDPRLLRQRRRRKER
jgi:hypothetical protein